MAGAGRLATVGALAGRRRRLLGWGASLLALGFIVWALVDGWTRVSDYSWELSLEWLVGAALVLGAFYVASGLGWCAILRRLHRPVPPVGRTLDIWGRSLLARYVPGNVLMVAGRVVMLRDAGVPRRVTLAATVYEQALGVGAAGLGSLAFLAAYSDLGKGAVAWAAAAVPLGLVLLDPRLFGRASGWALARAGREPLAVLLSTRQVAGLLAWYALTAALLGTGVWMLVRGTVGPEAGGPAFVGLAFLLAFTLAMLAFVFPSGLGVRDGLFALALAQNVPSAVAVAASLGVRLALTLVEVAFVGAAVVAGRRR